MFTKHITELQFSDIEDLINVQKVQEGYHLDYKEDIGNPDRFKLELSKDVSSFGNSDGGFLIIGVSNSKEIVGIDPTIQNKPVDEWINQILVSNIDPPLFYYDPRVIPIPGKDKVLVIIYVPESTKKPHMVSEKHQYFTRNNDSNKPTTHNQVREMFEYSRNRTTEYHEFLQKRNLLREDSPEFGQNLLTKKLYSDIPTRLSIPKPLIIFSLIPKYPNEELIKIPYRQEKDWLEKNNSGYPPTTRLPLFYPTGSSDLKLDGVVFKRMEGDNLMSYFEISNNGYIEVGFSHYLFSTFLYRGNIESPMLFWTEVVGFEWLLLEFSRKFYDFIRYYDNIELQISFVNVLNFTLLGWNRKKHDDTRFRYDSVTNNHHNSFKINTLYNPKTLSDELIKEILKDHSSKLGRGFGLEHDYCFDEGGNIDEGQLSHLLH